jgi:hypothetical protein
MYESGFQKGERQTPMFVSFVLFVLREIEGIERTEPLKKVDANDHTEDI